RGDGGGGGGRRAGRGLRGGAGTCAARGSSLPGSGSRACRARPRADRGGGRARRRARGRRAHRLNGPGRRPKECGAFAGLDAGGTLASTRLDVTMSAVSHGPLRAGPRAVERILAAGRPTLIVFETRRCAPCESLVPLLEGLARDFADRVTVVRVDARQAWVAARHHLAFVPTLVFFDRGR